MTNTKAGSLHGAEFLFGGPQQPADPFPGHHAAVQKLLIYGESRHGLILADLFRLID